MKFEIISNDIYIYMYCDQIKELQSSKNLPESGKMLEKVLGLF